MLSWLTFVFCMFLYSDSSCTVISGACSPVSVDQGTVRFPLVHICTRLTLYSFMVGVEEGDNTKKGEGQIGEGKEASGLAGKDKKGDQGQGDEHSEI